jgi:hypothetical protein
MVETIVYAGYQVSQAFQPDLRPDRGNVCVASVVIRDQADGRR